VPRWHASPAKKAQEFVMSAGGDFELVFAVRPDGLDEARRACALTVIGEIIEFERIENDFIMNSIYYKW
jgi:thiamine monophosphate kinase